MTEDGLLTRIDERTLGIIEHVKNIEKRLESCYVTQQEFKPIKSLVYAFVAIILTSAILALVSLIMK